MTGKDTILTERLKLIKVDQQVLDKVFNELTSQQQMDFLGCKNITELQEQYTRYSLGLSTFNRKFLYFFIREKSTDKHIGWCGFHTWYTDHFRAEIGYTLDSDFHNKGLMTEALDAVLNYGFQKMRLRRVEALVGTDNLPSKSLLRKFGFQYEGLLKKHYNINGKNEDSEIHALLNSEQIK